MSTLTLRYARQFGAALAPLYPDPRPVRLFDRLSAAVSGLLGAETTPSTPRAGY